jgi:hypothetical protein
MPDLAGATINPEIRALSCGNVALNRERAPVFRPGIPVHVIDEETRVFRDTEAIAFIGDQATRARKLFAAVVLAALDDAIRDEKTKGTGAEELARWARSRDGREVLSCAGIDPTDRAIDGMVAFVRRGVRVSAALRRGDEPDELAA